MKVDISYIKGGKVEKELLNEQLSDNLNRAVKEAHILLGNPPYSKCVIYPKKDSNAKLMFYANG